MWLPLCKNKHSFCINAAFKEITDDCSTQMIVVVKRVLPSDSFPKYWTQTYKNDWKTSVPFYCTLSVVYSLIELIKAQLQIYALTRISSYLFVMILFQLYIKILGDRSKSSQFSYIIIIIPINGNWMHLLILINECKHWGRYAHFNIITKRYVAINVVYRTEYLLTLVSISHWTMHTYIDTNRCNWGASKFWNEIA